MRMPVQSPPVAKDSEIKFRVEPELKQEMEDYAARLGLNLSSYLRFLHAGHVRDVKREEPTDAAPTRP